MIFEARATAFFPVRVVATIGLAGWLAIGVGCATTDDFFGHVRPVESPTQQILDLPSIGTNSSKLNFALLPSITGRHAVISKADPILKFQLHSYLAYHDGLYWAMWSQGPPTEDEPTQQVRYATSADGLVWSEAKPLTGSPRGGYGYIARGFWNRDGKLLALVAHFKGRGAFGADKDLELRAFEWNGTAQRWNSAGMVFRDAINNFAPERMPSGDWMMTRRDSGFDVYMLVGGRNGLDDWKSYPVVRRSEISGFGPDEPVWWNQPDGSQVALFRDNGASNRLFTSISRNEGKSWSLPTVTNFPNSPAKLYSLEIFAGCRALVSNANPAAGRREMHLSTSRDGRVFTRMATLALPGARGSFTAQYPNALVHDGHLLVTYSRNKAIIEVFKIPLAEIEPMCQ